MNDPGTNLNYWVSGGQINVSVPSTAPNAIDSAVCVEVNGMPAVLAGGVYRLLCVQSGKALDNGNTGNDGSPLIQWTANGGSPQQWTIIDPGHGSSGAVTALGNGAFRLVNRHSGKALGNDHNGADNTQVVQRTPNGGATQQWNMTKVG